MVFVKSQRPNFSSIFVFLTGKVVLALPATSLDQLSQAEPSIIDGVAQRLKDSSSRFQAIFGPRTAIFVQHAHNLSLGVWLLIGLGVLFFSIHTKMPKSVRERRLEKDYKTEPIGPSRARYVYVQDRKQSEASRKQKDINRIWIDAIQKGQSGEIGAISNDKSEACGHHDQGGRTSLRPPTLPPLTLKHDPYGGLGQLVPEETHDFGENPNYHDQGFQYSVPYLGTSLSTPPSPFSSRFYTGGIKKVKGHKRCQSLPNPYQIVDALVDLQTSFVSTSHFPLPTLRPLMSPDVLSIPGSTPVSASDGEETLNLSTYRYSSQYPEAQQDQRAQSVPLTPAPVEISPYTCESNRFLDVVQEKPAETEPEGTDGNRPENVFQPVMIFEQGHSVTGQKWRRKVTVFRSEILERLQKEGLVIR